MAREILLAVDVEADAKEVTDALTTRDGLAAFWTPTVTIDGDALEFDFERAPVPLRLSVAAVEPGSRVAWVDPQPWPHWAGTAIEWRVTTSPEGGTRVVLRHDGWPADYADDELGSVAFVWGLVMAALQRYLATGTPDPALR